MRLWSAQRRFGEVRRLTAKAPDVPAAVPIYNRGRTRMLVFDLDATRGGRQAVLADRARILGWLQSCGGRAVVDSSTSGGCHVLVPLDRAVELDALQLLLTAAARRCPTLDVSPMLNTATGCITVPGAVCKQGGRRRLLGLLDAAAEVLQDGNPAQILLDLQAHLGVGDDPGPTPAAAAIDVPSPFFDHGPTGPQLAEKYWKQSPMPAAVAAFAQSGVMPSDGRWPSRSEARQSVLTHALWRGYTLADIERLIQPHQVWHTGLGQAYERYRSTTQHALAADWRKAQQWVHQALTRIQACTHKKVEHTGGRGATPATEVPARWLAHALWWCDTSLRSAPHRWTVAAVLQGLALSGARAGEVINGVVVVGVGGRSLSIAAGLISESSVWSALRLLRETPGSPVLLVSKGRGLQADRYALTTPDVLATAGDERWRAPVAQVHPAWSMIGLQYRRLFEVVEAGAASTVAEVATTARVSRSSAYDGVAELCRIGLLRRYRGRLELGDTSLDALGERLGVESYRAARIEAHQHDREVWRRYLATRAEPVVEPELPRAPAWVTVTAWDLLEGPERQDYLAAVMATGPPAE